MKNALLTFLLIIVSIFGSSPLVFGQAVPQTASDNPLSTVKYLLSTIDQKSANREKMCLANSLAQTERYGEVSEIIDITHDRGFEIEGFAAVANLLLNADKKNEATEIINLLLPRVNDDPYLLESLFKPLIRLGRLDDTLATVNKMDESNRIESSFDLAKELLAQNLMQDARAVVENIGDLVKRSKYNEDRAQFALYLSKVGKKDEALNIIDELLNGLSWRSGKPEYSESRIINLVVETYRTLGMHGNASVLLDRQGVADAYESQSEIVYTYFNNGDLESAERSLESLLNHKYQIDANNRHDVGKLVNIYILRGKLDKAEAILFEWDGTDYSHQTYLMKIADIYIKNGNRIKAKQILGRALRLSNKIDVSEKEDGRLWTSPKMDQANYQAAIASRFITLHEDKQALKIISEIKKPYLRAFKLAEYVSANRTKRPVKELSANLETAAGLLKKEKNEIFDARRYDVYGSVAKAYSDIGKLDASTKLFADALETLSNEMTDSGTSSGLIFSMCSIGVAYEHAKIPPSNVVRSTLKKIIENWEDDFLIG